MTKRFSGETYTMSWVLPLIFGMIDKSLASLPEDLAPVATVKDKLNSEIKRRFHLAKLNLSSYEVLVSALDPRFRALRFLTEVQRSAVHHNVTEKASFGCDDSPPASQPESTLSSKPAALSLENRLLGEEIDDSGYESITHEVYSYFAEKPIKRNDDPLAWWEVHSSRFPRLAVLAREIHCVPATSTPSERVFSISGIIVDKRRASQSPAMLNALVFLNRNPFLHSEPNKALPPVQATPLLIPPEGDEELDDPELPALA